MLLGRMGVWRELVNWSTITFAWLRLSVTLKRHSPLTRSLHKSERSIPDGHTAQLQAPRHPQAAQVQQEWIGMGDQVSSLKLLWSMVECKKKQSGQ